MYLLTPSKNVKHINWLDVGYHGPSSFDHTENAGNSIKSAFAAYQNAYSILKWQFAKGHKWETKPMNMKSGTWCPVCARER